MKVFQSPNKSAISWISSGLAYVFGNQKVKNGAVWPFVASLGFWSWGEARHGTNKFRKGLGWAGLAVATFVAIKDAKKYAKYAAPYLRKLRG